MLAAFLQDEDTQTATYKLRVVPKPTLDALPTGSVLIQNIGVSICGTDICGKGAICGCAWRMPTNNLDSFKGCIGGSGHETIGKVVQVVEPSSLKVGDVVLAMVTSYISAVESVASVFEQRTGVSVSSMPKQGAFASYFISHDCACLLLPHTPPKIQHFNPLWYCAAQPLGTVIHAVMKLGSIVGKNIVVFGQGQNGLLLTAVLVNGGARRVVVFDRLSNRLRVASELGATHAILVEAEPSISEQAQTIEAAVRDATDGAMADIAVDAVGHQGTTVDLCARMCRHEGTVLLFGLPPREGDGVIAIRHCDFTRSISYQCSHSPSMETFAVALELLQQGRINVAPIFTHIVPFQEFSQAFDRASTYSDDVIKTILTFD